MPTSGTMGTSFSAWQSQLGETSTTRDTWKQGRPSTTALVYSAIFLFRIAGASSYRHWMASLGHTARHRAQPTHLSVSMVALPSAPNWGAPWAQILAQARQPMHFFCLTKGLPELCCSILPAREPQPMPMFFRVPPMPACSWPLKWVREMNTSASITARPILADFTYSPPSTGTSTSSLPFRPSAIRMWQPVE